MKRMHIVVWSAAALLVGGVAFAGMGKDGKTKDSEGMMNRGSMMSTDAHFKDMDADASGMISWEEFHNRFTRTQRSVFDILDTDKDSSLNHEEWEAFQQMHKGMGTSMGSKFHDKALPDPSTFNVHFPDMDANKDDMVDLSEFKAHFPDAPDTEEVFKAIDLDQDGNLDHDEWHEFKSAHGMKHKE